VVMGLQVLQVLQALLVMDLLDLELHKKRGSQ
jgi:hypothetical protein